MIGKVEGRGGCMADYRDGQDNPGIKVPPPLIYVLPLILGLLLDRKAHNSSPLCSMERAWGGTIPGGTPTRWVCSPAPSFEERCAL
jgi:hypothetical protein